MEKIEVRYQHILQRDFVPIYHKYIVYTDKYGQEWIARGGPSWSTKDVNWMLDTSYGKFTEDFAEYKNRLTDPRETIIIGSDLNKFWSRITNSLNNFDMDNIYRPFGNNSNATINQALIDALLSSTGLDRGPGGLYAPGYDKIYPDKDDDDPKDFPDLTNPRRYDPLVLDLNGDGVKLTSVVGSKVKFDFGADGFKEQTGWVSAQDGLLVLDKNKNGKIDNGTELFGSATQDGFAALAAYDKDSKGKKDGKINASDVIFSQLRVWQDKNGNGITDAGELLTLAQAGVKEISLTKTASGVDNAGNRVDYTGFFTRTNGKAGNAAAISFTVNQTLTEWTPPKGYKPSTEAEKLPGLNGYGRLKDLTAQATSNATFLKLVKDYVTASATVDAAKLVSGFDALLYAWAGVDKLVPNSRGGLVDARKLGFLAAFFNDGFYDSGNVTNQGQANQDNNTYASIRDSLLTRFLAGVPLSIWLTTGDAAKTYANRFMPLMMLGLSPDNQFSGSFENALRDVFAAAPTNAAQAKPYLDVMKAALNGAKTDYFDGNEAGYNAAVYSAVLSAMGRGEGAKAAMLLQTYIGQASTVLAGSTTEGSSNDDLYLWGGGNDVINDRYWNNGGDKLVLTGITPNQVKVSRNGNDLILTIAPSAVGKTDGGTITLKDQLVSDFQAGIDQVVFADGSTWDAAQLRNAIFTSTAANETFEGTNTDDTFTYARGGGNDVINDRYWNNGGDKLVLTGITPNQVKMSRNGNDLILTIAPSAVGKTDGGTITLKDQLVSDFQAGIDQVVFADGSTWDAAQLRNAIFTSTAANETFEGTNTDDTFTYARGGGNDVINERYWNNGGDKLVLTGITPNQVKVSRNGNDLILTIAPSAVGKNDGGTITLKDQLVSDFQAGIDQVVFADGSTWDAAQLVNFTNGTSASDNITGTENSELLFGMEGNDILNGAGGADYLVGGLGNDRFVFTTLNFGNDVISDFEGGHSVVDVLEFNKTMVSDWTALLSKTKQSGMDTLISVTANDTVTLKNFSMANLNVNDVRFV